MKAQPQGGTNPPGTDGVLLRACPMCQSRAELDTRASPIGFPYKIRCTSILCGVQTPFLRSQELAWQIWNRRTRRPAVRAPKGYKAKRNPNPADLD